LESFVQHDPNLADGRPGLKAFAAEVASSPKSDITIDRTLVDGDIEPSHRLPIMIFCVSKMAEVRSPGAAISSQ